MERFYTNWKIEFYDVFDALSNFMDAICIFEGKTALWALYNGNNRLTCKITFINIICFLVVL